MDSSSGKAAIPRIHVEPRQTRTRVTRACKTCRERKTKCDGQKPSCGQCLALIMVCVYPSSRREENNATLERLASQNERYESLLRNIADRGGPIAGDIRQALGDPGQENQSSASSSSPVESLSGLDVVNEDLNRNEESRATGFMGKNSEVSWLQGLEIETERISRQKNNPEASQAWLDPWRSGSEVWNENQTASNSYHENKRDMREYNQLDPYGLPPKHVADVYYDVFLRFVDNQFPIIRRSLFSVQYERYFTEPTLNPGKKWLSVLNLIFAIASRYCSSVGEDVHGGSEDGVFLSRARMLSAHDNIIYENPDLQQVQIETLLSFYLLVSSQVNMAWKMIRVASSSAISLGVNMRNVDERTDPVSKETRRRLWCSIFMLEQFLTTMTGRPTSLYKAHSVDAPLPFAESRFTDLAVSQLLTGDLERAKVVGWTLFESASQTSTRSEQLKSVHPSPSLYFFYQVDLSLIANAITSRLYGAHAPQDGWRLVKGAIMSYSQKLDSWMSTINEGMSFADGDGKPFHSILSQNQVGLALNFYSTRILLNRPCLSRPGFRDRSGIRIPRNRFGNDTALACVRSALSLLDVLPNEASEDWFYGTAPWWTMLHFLMQAATVLLIQLAVGPVPVRTEQRVEKGITDEAASPDKVLWSCKKALHWLYHMARKDPACRRGFKLCHSLLCRIASSKDLNCEDVPSPLLLQSPDGSDPNAFHGLSRLQSSSESSTDQTDLFSDSIHGEGIGGREPTTTTTTTASDIGMENIPNELFFPDLVEDPEIAWFISVADLDPDSTMHDTQ